MFHRSKSQAKVITSENFKSTVNRAGIFKESMGLGTEEEERYRTGPPVYIGWKNSFLGIDSWAP
jgi:hypothetical protein